MKITKFNSELDELVDLLCSNDWIFHTKPIINKEAVEQAVIKGYYTDGRETFWIAMDGEKVGIVIIDDIEDTIPLFDLRLTKSARGNGLGVKSLQWLKDYLYGEKGKIRIEGYTRADNLAMRKCFAKAGFVKEGYLRNAWENEDGTIADTVLYASIYEDWKQNKITPIKLDEYPF
ncbi:GNAT family N-acetyltransferase [Solibacillus silvestris]|uniref:GNAT family N-acetyltransferase n=1 Tax=Solibacillus silvestris TaxID=76853 RepID=UPI003F8121FA